MEENPSPLGEDFSLNIFSICGIIGKHHIGFTIKYHSFWITKYRKNILKGELARRVRILIKEVCNANEVEIIKGNISVSKLIQYRNGKSSRTIMSAFNFATLQPLHLNFYTLNF